MSAICFNSGIRHVLVAHVLCNSSPLSLELNPYRINLKSYRKKVDVKQGPLTRVRETWGVREQNLSGYLARLMKTLLGVFLGGSPPTGVAFQSLEARHSDGRATLRNLRRSKSLWDCSYADYLCVTPALCATEYGNVALGTMPDEGRRGRGYLSSIESA